MSVERVAGDDDPWMGPRPRHRVRRQHPMVGEDDGPLPEVITDTLAAQDEMKRHTTRATFAVLIATALHAIATGNMLPAFVTNPDGSMRELPTICVDSSEFVVSKLKDRGTHQAFGVVTNAQDFMHILRLYVERELTDRDSPARKGARTMGAAT